MAEHEQIIPKNHQAQADDHYYQGLKAGDWLLPIPQVKPVDQAAFNVMDNAANYGLENQQQQDPGFPPMGPQPDVSVEPSGQ